MKKTKQQEPYVPRFLKDTRKGRRKKRFTPLRLMVLVIMAAMVCIGALGLGAYAGLLVNEQEQLERLSQTVQEQIVDTIPSESTVVSAAETQPSIPTESPDSTKATETAESEDRVVLAQYAQLHQENPDLFGWITIEDTRINYPVMHSPNDPERYLHADFEGSYSYAGLPFLDAKCTEDSDNLLIYAHNMLDGSMFRSLLKYENKDYWEAHPTIRLDTLYEEQEYEILSAFYDRVYYKTENVFKFYQFIDAYDQSDFDNAIDHFKAKQLYDTGVYASYGDQLITLVTCAYHTNNGRFVVVARKITE